MQGLTQGDGGAERRRRERMAVYGGAHEDWMMRPPTVEREKVLGFRVRAQQLDRARGGLADTAALSIGVQDTGPDGGLWALAVRGLEIGGSGNELATVWTIRGAPHLYRRNDLGLVAAAVEPFSDADAGKRIFDAAKPLKAAGTP